MGFADDEIAVRSRVEVVNVARWKRKLHANWNNVGDRRLDLVNRQDVGIAADKLLEPAFLEHVIAGALFKADALESPRRTFV